MDNILSDHCSSEDLKAFEKKYNEELCSKGSVASTTQFEYACFLVRSRYGADIEKGVLLLEELYKKPDERGKRDYVYYLAVGNARLKKYDLALNYTKGLLRVEPGNRQVSELETEIKKMLHSEGMKGVAILGAVIVGVGALIGIGISAARK